MVILMIVIAIVIELLNSVGLSSHSVGCWSYGVTPSSNLVHLLSRLANELYS